MAGVAILAGTPAAQADPLPVPYGNGEMARVAVTGWDAPVPGANDFGCVPSAEHPEPVVLTGSTFLSAAVNWTALAPYLHNLGFCVYTVDYGREIYRIPPGLNGMDPIPPSAAQVGAVVDRVLAATGATRVHLVGHSQGGVVNRYYVNRLGGADKVSRMVLISSPYRPTGLPVDVTALARDIIPAELYQAILYNGRIAPLYLNFIDPWVWGAVQTLQPHIEYTLITDIADEVGLLGGMGAPADAANATTRYINDFCPFDFSQHFAQPYSRTAVAMVGNALDPAHAVTPPCTFVPGYTLG
ncbi:esterase/lipase family protein [Nocardia huaxiensis]|uniref:esterase/lipase family protein n=1 Tax=Nocardia huaxiensis TaxID=2755382 RepID=UPI001E448F6B|nr:alpha/beta fold hydrolase [Nocardia huaxiensis]UFS97290.1 alpha/beta fold hydrolase [Nocardia huaxiensis]